MLRIHGAGRSRIFVYPERPMPTFLAIDQFLRLRDAGVPVLDVRSPGEFACAHMAGAQNLPLFSDAERAQVGTCYARQGRTEAVLLALRLVGDQLAGKAGQALDLCRSSAHAAASPARPHVLLYCWRGGMRSRSMAWLLESCGLTVALLHGGYKSYRRHARYVLGLPRPVLVLSGLTGCGKTDMLHALAALGEQVVDLEGLACHRGSAFGAVGLSIPQPGNEDFENRLFEQWRRLDPQRPVWLEDESRRIGQVTLCEEFFHHIDASPLIMVHLPLDDRIRRLVRIYSGDGHNPAVQEALCAALQKLQRRLGSETTARCCAAVRAGQLEDAVRAVLTYYDKCYAHQQQHRSGPLLASLDCTTDCPEEAARQLRRLALSAPAAL